MDRRRRQANSSPTYCQSVVNLYPEQLGGATLPPIAARMNVIGRVSAKPIQPNGGGRSSAALVVLLLSASISATRCMGTNVL